MAQYVLYWMQGGVPQKLEFDNYNLIESWVRENMRTLVIQPDCRFYCRWAWKALNRETWMESLPRDMASQTKFSAYYAVQGMDWIPKPIRMLVLIED